MLLLVLAVARRRRAARVEHGIATWNIEYLQVGDPGGGWPGIFLDWGSAADHLRVLAKSGPLDLTHVVAVGHSAGELAALWVATRGASCRREAAFAGATRFTSRPRWRSTGPWRPRRLYRRRCVCCDKSVIVPQMGGNPSAASGALRPSLTLRAPAARRAPISRGAQGANR
jgi:hypothetical protein